MQMKSDRGGKRQIYLWFALLWVGGFSGGALAQEVTPPSSDEPVLHRPMPRDLPTEHRSSSQPSVIVREPGGDPAGDEDAPALMPSEPLNGGDTHGRVGGEIVYRAVSEALREESLVHNVSGEIKLDRATEREGILNYHSVFDPTVVPMKRNNARGQVGSDLALEVGQSILLPVPVVGRGAAGGRALFWANLLVDLVAEQPVPIPSVSPEARILEVHANPPIDGITFMKDGADNYFIQAKFSGRVRLQILTDASDGYFTRAVIDTLPIKDVITSYPGQMDPLPPDLVRTAPRVWQAIGVDPGMSVATALSRMVQYFREFEPGSLTRQSEDLYLDVALAKRGVCRHRSHAFVLTALSLGLPARYVSNEAHVFVEVWTPEGGWLRIDLGGGAEGMEVHGGEDRRRHVPDGSDPFEHPSEYANSYSGESLSGRLSGFSSVRGLPKPESADYALSSDTTLWGDPFPDRPGMRKTRTTLLAAESSVFRGEGVAVEGRVEEISGVPAPGLPVVIFLVPATLRKGGVEIGSGQTDDSGVFRVEAHIPSSLSVGRYVLIARTPGSGLYRGSMSSF